MEITIKVYDGAAQFGFIVKAGHETVANGCRFSSCMEATQEAMRIALSICEGAPGRAPTAEIREHKHAMMTAARGKTYSLPH
jgi:hypothetical protein